MRRFSITALLLVIMISGGCHSGNRLLRRSLTKKLYTFFTKTLQDNYHSNSEDELYRRFLYDYLHHDVKLDNLNEKKLNIICDELFKRDMDHYYYFYAEFINYKTDEKYKDNTCKFFSEKYPDIPVAIDCKFNNNKLLAKDSPFVYLNIQDESYLSTVDTEKHTSIKEVCECKNNFKELNLYDISTYFLKGKGSQQLDRKDVRGFLAIVFWKVLCAKAHIDFYNIYDPQKIAYINELEEAKPLTLISTSDEMKANTSGYVNSQGDTIIPIGKYTYCYTPVFDIIAVVGLKDKTGFFAIDRNQKVLFEICAYDNGPDYVKNGLFRIIENGKIGYANMQGEVIVKPQFDFALPFQHGYAVVAIGGEQLRLGEHSTWQGGKWGIIDTTGTFKVQPVYDGANSVGENGETSVQKNGKWEILKIE